MNEGCLCEREKEKERECESLKSLEIFATGHQNHIQIPFHRNLICPNFVQNLSRIFHKNILLPVIKVALQLITIITLLRFN